MATWSKDDLNRIGSAEEIQLASFRADGTLRKPVTIWVVRVGEDLYVRSVNGREGAWFRGTQVRHAGHLKVGGIVIEVAFTDAEEGVNDQVDAAYRSKYRRYAPSIVNSILTPQARASTILLLPV